MGAKRKDWKKLLKKQEIKDKAIIITKIPDNVKRYLKINFKCNCGKKYNKTIRLIIENSGLFCKFCTQINSNNKKKEKCLKNYGIEHFMKSEKGKENFKQKCLDNYGVENPSQSSIIKQQKIETCLKNYGVCHPMKSKLIKDQMKQKNFNKYGVENPMQNIEVFKKAQKNKYKRKKYIFKTEEILEVQGYEPIALKLLEEQGYKYEDIEIEPFSIIYKFKNKEHHHFPDIYIPKENKIIEVKSDYTYSCVLEINKQKQLYAMSQGYIYEFWVFDGKGNLEIL